MACHYTNGSESVKVVRFTPAEFALPYTYGQFDGEGCFSLCDYFQNITLAFKTCFEDGYFEEQWFTVVYCGLLWFTVVYCAGGIGAFTLAIFHKLETVKKLKKIRECGTCCGLLRRDDVSLHVSVSWRREGGREGGTEEGKRK